jgi:hypothetical protein
MMRTFSFRPALLAVFGASVLAGCAVPPTPSANQSSIISRLPSDYAYAAPTPVEPQPAPAAVQTPTPTPPLTEQERQRYADIDKQVQREQTQSMAAYEAARYAYYYPQPIYYAPPVVVGGYYGGYYGGYGGYGYRGCCWGGGPRWSVGVGYSTGWGW